MKFCSETKVGEKMSEPLRGRLEALRNGGSLAVSAGRASMFTGFAGPPRHAAYTSKKDRRAENSTAPLTDLSGRTSGKIIFRD